MRISQLILIAVSFFSLKSFAHYTVQETGDLLRENQMQASTELQFQTSGDDGVNILGRIDTGFTYDSNLRFVLGAGVTDYQAGGYIKWVPYPDIGNQPAIGFTTGAMVARYSNANELAVRFIPFISKRFESDRGIFTPFVSLPVAFSSYDDKSYTPLQFVIGSRYAHPDFDSCDFTAEIGFDLNDSFSYVSFGLVFPAFEEVSVK